MLAFRSLFAAAALALAAPADAQTPAFEEGVNAEVCFDAYRAAFPMARVRAEIRMRRLRQIMGAEPEASAEPPAAVDVAFVQTLHACERSLMTSGIPFADFSYLLWRTRGPEGGPAPSNFRCAATYVAHAEVANAPASATRAELPSLQALAQQAFQARLAELGPEDPQLMQQAVMREASSILNDRGFFPDEKAQADFMRPRTECDRRFAQGLTPQ